MDWRQFLSGLFEDGRLTIPPMEALSRGDLAALGPALNSYEATARLNAPGGAPPWDEDAGSWAAAMFYRSCQFVIHRDLDERAIRHQLGGESPEPTASAHYSVDLCFRYLPDLLRFARSAAEDDPLVEQLTKWAADWPLSSIGVEGLSHEQLRMEGITQSDSLTQMYVDRLIAAGDKTRLDDPVVREAFQRSIGAHEQLAPAELVRAAAAFD